MATTDKEIKQLILNVLTEEQYASATKNDDELYLTPISESDSTDSKTISLFGNHSILVPSTSTDTNIDIYVHNIVGKSSIANEVLYLTIYSSSNLNVDSPTDLNTILKTASRCIPCSGVCQQIALEGGTFISIDWKGSYATSKLNVLMLAQNNALIEINLSTFTTFTDVVTTI